ncbi:MAG: hypothetical protein JXB29_10610 [Sedimentisphaerales bacterium]|nr:hypothetical protein [Sedimentisphaerales bacterium]
MQSELNNDNYIPDIQTEKYFLYDVLQRTFIDNGNWFLQIFGASPKSVFHSYYETTAQTEALVAILATLRYKIDAGRFPETLNELVSSGYLKAVPNDPYSNSSLVYMLTEDGFKLYSVGADFKDDDGVVKLDIIYWPVQQRKEIDVETKKGPGELKLNRNLKRVKF